MDVWHKAIQLKTVSTVNKSVGMDFNDMNELMQPMTSESKKENEKREEDKERENVRTDTVRNPNGARTCPNSNSLTNNLITKNSSNSEIEAEIKKVKTFLDMKNFLVKYKRCKSGRQLVFQHCGESIKISNRGIPYFSTGELSNINLDYNQADNFFKDMLNSKHELLKVLKKCHSLE
jgi:hypothetical protein